VWKESRRRAARVSEDRVWAPALSCVHRPKSPVCTDRRARSSVQVLSELDRRGLSKIFCNWNINLELQSLFLFALFHVKVTLGEHRRRRREVES